MSVMFVIGCRVASDPGTSFETSETVMARSKGYDPTGLAFQPTKVSQLVSSATALTVVLVQGHYGGTSYTTW